jgi:hypothetical protein
MTRVARRGLAGYCTTGGAIAYYPSFDREFNTVECEAVDNGVNIGQYSTDVPYPGGKYNRCKFKTHIRPAVTGTKIPEFDVLLKGCGFSEDVELTYVLDDPKRDGDGTGDTVGADIRMWSDGLTNTLIDGVGNAKFMFEAGKIPYIEWEFIGDYQAVDALAAPSLTTANLNDPVPWVNASVACVENSQARTGLVVESIAYDLGNMLDPRPSGSGTYGYDSPIINGREPVIDIKVEARDIGATVATSNWEATYLARADCVWTFSHNPSATADQQLDVTFTGVLMEYPQLSESNGKLVYDLKFKQKPSAAFTLEVTET